VQCRDFNSANRDFHSATTPEIGILIQQIGIFIQQLAKTENIKAYKLINYIKEQQARQYREAG